MRYTIFFLLVLLALPALAKDSESKARSQLRTFLGRMSQIEAQVHAIEPMHLPLQGRTAAQDREMTGRIEQLDKLYSKDTLQLGKELNRYGADVPDSLNPQYQSVKDTYGAFSTWVDTRLQYQNAGVKNPGLKALEKLEKTTYADYKKAFSAVKL